MHRKHSRILTVLFSAIAATAFAGPALDEMIASGGEAARVARENMEHPALPLETPADTEFRRMLERALAAGTITPAQAAKAMAQYQLAKAQREANAQAERPVIIIPIGGGAYQIQRQ